MKYEICKPIVIAMIVATTQANADVTVRGSPTCQSYLSAKAKAKQGETSEAINNLVWLLGYMSGLAVGTQVNVLGKGDNGESMLNWLDVYCPRYPTKYLSDAGDMYYGFLKEQNGLK